MLKINYFSYIILVIAFLLAINPNIFERLFYFNEVLSLLGAFCFLFSFKFKNNCNSIIFAFISYALYLLLVYLSSLFTYTDVYAYVRHSSMLYSMFSFFSGVFVFSRGKTFIRFCNFLNRKVFIFLLLISFPIQRIFALSVFPMVFHKDKALGGFYWLIFSYLVVAIVYGGGSSLFAIIVLLAMYLCANVRVFVASVSVFFVFFIAFYFYIWNDLQSFLYFRVHPYSIGGVLAYIYNLDPNLLTRLALWMYAIDIWFDNVIFGIGFGVEMFDPGSILLSFEDVEKNESLGYFLGAHNSILTLLARTGVFGVAIFLLFNYRMLFLYFKCRKHFRRVDLISLNCFFVSFSVLLLNVVIESPVNAGVFWFVCGLSYSSLIRIENEYYNGAQLLPASRWRR